MTNNRAGRSASFPFAQLACESGAYTEFEQRVGETVEPPGAKAALVRDAIARQPGAFRVADMEQACPGVGRDWIRSILRKMKAAGEIRSSGRGPSARWERI